tara:strand:- start:381 stop:1226 length:846 start_codon:yes stop_codon:yes gene_type:complete
MKDNDTKQYLFKYSRTDTGEHWSEKIAEELCKLLGIPHATYEIASFKGRIGVFTPNLVSENHRMVMGNEVLHTHTVQYPNPSEESQTYVKVKEHTVTRVLGCLDKAKIKPPLSADNSDLSSSDYFCGYLLLDTLISNQDRHHENWAIILNNTTSENFLCPTYDHAASLGRELKDHEKEERLATKDKCRTVDKFVTKAKSAIYKLKTDKKPLSTLDAFLHATERKPTTRKYWIDKIIDKINEDTINNLFDKFPEEIFSKKSKEFACKMIIENKKRLLSHEIK